MLSANEIRSRFLDFFREKGHHIVPSAPVVVKNDPTLLFTNAGMNQFKDYFLGNKKPPYTRVADTQKCLRVSGKHNDLEEVGVDTYHHTMFEMLGNWSFGDYFKKEAIAWSWELLTEVFRIPEDRLYVTFFEGDEREQLPRDTEAYECWRQHVSAGRILPGNKKDNFWEMGDTGPCGPCSEIHVDCRSEEERKAVDGKTLVNADHPQVIEIWNNVFMQFNRMKDGTLEPLPAQHVDTGMGLERLVRVLQGKQSNYDTDLFTGTIAATEAITGKKYDYGDSKVAVAFRVLADHIRAIAFTIADGQLPSNTGAGYVIRRILRRAVRYYYSYLNYKQPLLHQLIPQLGRQFENVFPELYKQEELVTRVIKEEEEAFLRTLDKGLKRIEELPRGYWLAQADTVYGNQYDLGNDINANRVHEQKNAFLDKHLRENTPITISGEIAFELNDTYGFPIDLTALIARERGWTVDMAGFEAALQKQKTRSRAAAAIDTEDWVVVHDVPGTAFVGYEDFLVETKITRYRKAKAKGKEQYQLVLETTPFYAESGGQVGDTGVLESGGRAIRVTDTRKENDLVVHFTDRLPEAPELPVTAKVDVERRFETTYNHSATHLMHAALRRVLGTHVAQKGSLVSPDVLRFDFSHFGKMTEEEIREVERIVNEKIRANIPVVIREMPKEEALKLGAMALFGEKYGDVVRVVVMDPAFSIELCGGTHVGHTGMIGVFTIVSESAVAAGVRRIEALTGPAAIRYFVDKVSQQKQLAELLKTNDPLKTIARLLDDKAALEKKVEALETKELAALGKELAAEAVTVNGVRFVGQRVNVTSADALKKLCFDLKQRLSDYLVVLTAAIEGKAHAAVLIDEAVAASKNLDAAKLIKQVVAPLIKGGGGGQKTLATAGGQDTGKLHEVIDAVRDSLLSAG